MKRDNILQIIGQGENSTVEFKNAEVKPDAIANEIVAFANLGGGVILLGVDDNKKISGIINDKNYEEWCINIARNNIIPAINIIYSEHEIENEKIGIIQVPKGKDKPYQTNNHKFLIRVGSTNRHATIQELMRLFQQSGMFHYDAISVEDTSIKHLNFHKISSYFDTYKINFDILPENEKYNLLKNSDIITENGKLSVAGLLIFGTNPQKKLLNASISFAHFAGNKINSTLIDKQNIEGNLSFQIDTTTALIKNNIIQSSEIIENKRVSNSENYPDKVFRELIVNACCHRNYSIQGSKIRVFLFNNRLEVISPGRLSNAVTIEKLKAGVSYANNPIIVKFMENLNYIDKLGRGLPMVYNEAIHLNKEVVFEEIGEEFKVTLYL